MELKKQYQKLLPLLKNGYRVDVTGDEPQFLVTDLKNHIEPSGELANIINAKPILFDPSKYFNDRMKELGITDKENCVLLEDKDGAKTTDAIFRHNKDGDILIGQHTLYGKAMTKGGQTAKMSDREKYAELVRLHPWKVELYNGKYDFTNAVNHPFWHPSLMESFYKKVKVKRLYITEGAFKAFKATMEGLPCVGLTSISHYRNKETGTLHPEILDFIKNCDVQELVVLWDGDCRNISTKQLKEGKELTARPAQFINYANAIKQSAIEFFPKLKVIFATIKSNDIEKAPKGIDDLYQVLNKNTILEDTAKFGSIPSIYFHWIDITKDAGIKKMRKYFCMDNVNNFYQLHQKEIGESNFVFYGSTYQIEKGSPVIEVPRDIKVYKRIGTEFFMIQNKPVEIKLQNNKERKIYEETLVGWKESIIRADHGKEALAHIEKYLGFTNMPSHTNYQQVHDGYWNVYQNIEHEKEEGSFDHIDKLLKHLFDEQYEMVLDYITILYRYPTKKLPVICLVSREQATGKSTFIYLMKLIFKNNMAIVSNNDLISEFNASWTSKLIVASEETILEKKEAYEKIKSLTTAKTIISNEKNQSRFEFPCNMHFIFCSNYEDSFIKIDEYDSRLWIRKVHTIKEKIKNFDDKIENEIPAFVNFIENREIQYKDVGERLYFRPEDLRTEAFYNVVKNSEPGIVKELRTHIKDYFLKYPAESELMMTQKDIREQFGIKADSFYLTKIFKHYFEIEKYTNDVGKQVSCQYSYLTENPEDAESVRTIRRNGRPYVIPKSKFFPGAKIYKQEKLM